MWEIGGSNPYQNVTSLIACEFSTKPKTPSNQSTDFRTLYNVIRLIYLIKQNNK